MQDTLTRAPAIAAVEAAPRFDMYLGIHKGLRMFWGDTITRVGNVDATDDAALAAVFAQTRDLLDLCELHYDDENRFIHPAIERVHPGATERIGEEHDQHFIALDELRAAILEIESGARSERAPALLRLHRALALYAAEDFEHMQFEDTELNAILWRHYSDAELHEIHAALLASIPPHKMMIALRWMVPALNAAERAGMFLEARQGMPAPVFQAVLGLAGQVLTPAEYKKLALALDAAT